MPIAVKEFIVAFLLTIVTIAPVATYKLYEDGSGTILGFTFCLSGHNCDDSGE